jgi:hypothetical protein
VNDAARNEEENKDENEDEDESAEVLASVPRLISTNHNVVQVNSGKLSIREGIQKGIGIGIGIVSIDKKRIRDRVEIK